MRRSSRPQKRPRTRLSATYSLRSRNHHGYDEVTDFDKSSDDSDDFSNLPATAAKHARNVPGEYQHEPSLRGDGFTENRAANSEVASCQHRLSPSPSTVLSAVTFKKIRIWLQKAFDTEERGLILLLVGPSGSGKSAAVYSLAAVFQCEVLEWRAPPPRDSSRSTTSSLLECLRSFFVGARYPSLVSSSSGREIGTFHKISPNSLRPPKSRRLILVDDLPFVADFASRHSIVNVADLVSTCSLSAPYPTIFIFSETGVLGGSMARMFGNSILQSPRVTVINVKPVTDAAMSRAISEALGSRKSDMPPNLIKELVQSCGGDIRAAMNVLRLCFDPELGFGNHLCSSDLSGDLDLADTSMLPSDSSSKSMKRVRERNRDNSAGSISESSSNFPKLISGVGQDVFLDTFHAVSKILNNKRTLDGISKNNPERVLQEAKADSATFISLLFQNYSKFFSVLTDSANAMNDLSECDAMLVWHQDESVRSLAADCAALTVTRSFLLNNTSPVQTGWRPIQGPNFFSEKCAVLEYLQTGREHVATAAHPTVYSNRVLSAQILPMIARWKKNMFDLASQLTDVGANYRSDGMAIAPEDGFDALDKLTSLAVGDDGQVNRLTPYSTEPFGGAPISDAQTTQIQGSSLACPAELSEEEEDIDSWSDS